jgi:hypothetical protein
VLRAPPAALETVVLGWEAKAATEWPAKAVKRGPRPAAWLAWAVPARVAPGWEAKRAQAQVVAALAVRELVAAAQAVPEQEAAALAARELAAAVQEVPEQEAAALAVPLAGELAAVAAAADSPWRPISSSASTSKEAPLRTRSRSSTTRARP